MWVTWLALWADHRKTPAVSGYPLWQGVRTRVEMLHAIPSPDCNSLSFLFAPHADSAFGLPGDRANVSGAAQIGSDTTKWIVRFSRSIWTNKLFPRYSPVILPQRTSHHRLRLRCGNHQPSAYVSANSMSWGNVSSNNAVTAARTPISDPKSALPEAWSSNKLRRLLAVRLSNMKWK